MQIAFVSRSQFYTAVYRRSERNQRPHIAQAFPQRPNQQHRTGRSLWPVAVACPPAPACAAYRIWNGAVPNRSAIDAGFVGYPALGLNRHTKTSREAFERAMTTALQGVSVPKITGLVKYLLRIEVADMPSQEAFYIDVFCVLPQANSITSCGVMGSPKDARA